MKLQKLISWDLCKRSFTWTNAREISRYIIAYKCENSLMQSCGKKTKSTLTLSIGIKMVSSSLGKDTSNDLKEETGAVHQSWRN